MGLGKVVDKFLVDFSSTVNKAFIGQYFSFGAKDKII